MEFKGRKVWVKVTLVKHPRRIADELRGFENLGDLLIMPWFDVANVIGISNHNTTVKEQ